MSKQITLSLDQAKELYGKDKTMDELILANFTKDELEKEVVKRWEDLNSIGGFKISQNSEIDAWFCSTVGENKNLFATKNQARGALAASQLSQLRYQFLKDNGYKNWKADWTISKSKYFPYVSDGGIQVGNSWHSPCFPAFPTQELALEFGETHRELLKEYYLMME